MRITILTIGSRGDVQPYMALAGGLKRAGHVVRLPAHETFDSDTKLTYVNPVVEGKERLECAPPGCGRTR